MKILKVLLLALIPIILVANIEYIKIENIASVKEGNLTRITKINGETFEYFKIYMENNVYQNINETCLVKFDKEKNSFTFSTGKPFKCGDNYFEFINKHINSENHQTFKVLLGSFIYDFLLPNSGKMLTLFLFMVTFITYLMTHNGKVLTRGVVLSLIIGASWGIYSVFYNDFSYHSRMHLVNYYDKIEEEKGHKIFRKGF